MLVMDTQEQKNNRPWLYKKGQSGNPGGRPKGSISMKTWLANKLAAMTEEEREEFISGMNKIDLLKMAEGNPKNDDSLKVEGNITIQISKSIADKNGINETTGQDSQ